MIGAQMNFENNLKLDDMRLGSAFFIGNVSPSWR